MSVATHEAPNFTGADEGNSVVRAVQRGLAERRERDGQMSLTQQLLAITIAAASKSITEVDPVPLVARLSGADVEKVGSELALMRERSQVGVIDGADDPRRVGRLHINPYSESGVVAGYMTPAVNAGGEHPLQRQDIVDIVRLTDELNLRLGACRETYFPQARP
jgi:hypothetical protein